MVAVMRCTDESVRLEVLREYDILDTPAEGAFDNITRIARMLLAAPMAAISLVDKDRQWFKSRDGLDFQETPRAISFCTHTINIARPMIVCDATKDDRFRDSPLVVETGVRFYVGMPLVTSSEHIVGTLCVFDTSPRDGVAADHLDALYALSRMVVDAIELRRLAIFDGLTNLLTRGAFRHAAKSELERSRRHGRLVSCVTIDIDRFKTINDTHGHAVGDAVLRHVAETLRVETRAMDVVGRLGGEEFAVLLPDTTVMAASKLAERLRLRLASTMTKIDGKSVSLTGSLGVAQCTPDDETIDAALERADQALHMSKSTGRNRATLFSTVHEPRLLHPAA